MCQLDWDPKTNYRLYPRLMAALDELLERNYDPEVDETCTLDALDVPYELDDDGKPQIDPVAMWHVSAIREIAAQTGKSIGYLLGEAEDAHPKCADELVETAINLKAAANALDELAELVMPNLPTGPRELFDVAETGIFDRIRHEASRAESVAKAISGKPEIDMTLEAGLNLSSALDITPEKLRGAIEEANVRIVKSNV